jgi:peptide/nickel transport system permease protein
MTGFIGRRILRSIPVLLLVLLVSFLIIRLVPGDPVTLMLGINASPESVATLKHDLGLDKSVGHQLASFLGQAPTLDFGSSIVKRDEVRSVIGSRILPSLYLIVLSVLVALILAFPLGILSAVKRNRLPDHAVRLLSMVAFAMPTFWLGLMLILLFSIKLGVLPSSGYGDGLVGVLRSLALPAITLGLYLAPMLLRTLRSSLIESLAMEYTEAARARGFSPARVVGKHALRNSLIPFVTVLSINVGFLISGTVVVEAVFQIPGLGLLLVQSVLSRDYPVIQGLVLLFGVAVILINLLSDVTYAVIDPRVRLEARG